MKNVSDLIEQLDEIFDLRPIIKNFGLIIKTIRTAKKLSQKDLAKAISKKTGVLIDQARISRIEANQRQLTAPEYMAFCLITGCSMGMIIRTNQVLTELEKSLKH